MTDHKFLSPRFGEPAAADRRMTEFRTEWEEMSARISSHLERPDHALMQFFNFSRDLDAWVRKWSAVADRTGDQSLRSTLAEAHASLQNLLAQARSVFEESRSRRVAEQQAEDARRWRVEQARAGRQAGEAEHRREMARMEEKLAATYREIDEINQSVRANARLSADRQNAMWNAVHFPHTTCACGKSKLSNQVCCYDCANRGRTYWF